MIIRGERIAVEIIKTGRQGGEGRQDDRKANKQDYRREKEDSTTKENKENSTTESIGKDDMKENTQSRRKTGRQEREGQDYKGKT